MYLTVRETLGKELYTSPPATDYRSDPALVAAVSAAANCAPSYTNQPAINDVGRAVAALNLKSCTYEKSNTVAAGAIISPYAIGAAGGQTTSQKSTGCEQINVISNMVNQCNKQLVCMINNASSKSTANVVVNQTIRLKAKDISGSKVSITNKSTVSMNLINLLQQTTQSAIAATIMQGIETTTRQAQSQSNEAFSDPNAQKQILQLTTNISNEASSTNIQQSVASTVAQLYSNQVIEIDVGDINQSTLDLNNVSAVELISQTLVYNALSQVFKSDAIQKSVAATDQSGSQQNKGVAAFFASPGGIALIVILVLLAGIGGLVYYYKQRNRQITPHNN